MKRILKRGVFTLAAGGMILWLLWRLWPADPAISQNQSQASYLDMHVHVDRLGAWQNWADREVWQGQNQSAVTKFR